MQFLAGGSLGSWPITILRVLGNTGGNNPTSFPVVLWEGNLRGEAANELQFYLFFLHCPLSRQ